MAESNLFKEFSPVSAEEWKNKIVQDIKGKSFDDLIQNTAQGFDLQPFYTKDEVEPLAIPMNRQFSGWQIRQDFIADNFEVNGKKIKEAAESGVNAIGIRIKDVPSRQEFSRLLAGVSLDSFSWHFFADEKTENILEIFLELLKDRKLDPVIIAGSFNLDPLCWKESPDYKAPTELLEKIRSDLPQFKALTVHSQPYHMEGKSVAEELCRVLNKVEQFWEGQSTSNYELSTLINQVQFSVPVGPNYFMEIAKLRALRWLWNDWQIKMGIDQPLPAFIQAQKSWKFNDEDAYQNILQHTTEAMAAVIGGCDVLNLKSIDQTDQLDNEFFERISRNIQLILKHESHLDKVNDPARGSYYVEALTRKLVEEVTVALDSKESL